MVSEISQTKTNTVRYHLYVELKKIIQIYKTETDSQTQKTNLWLPQGRRKQERQIRSIGLTDTNHYI